jgi:hypothetical protein
MTRPLSVLLDELDLLQFQRAEADEALKNINRSLEEDARITEAHHGARCEIAGARAVIDARISDLEHEITAQMPEEVDDEQLV